jgi:FixJ family two-component response regulator
MPATGKTIVIVEDDAGLHQAFKRVLTAAGRSPSIFDSAEALLACDPIEDTECYVLDVRLPGKSGIELGRELNASRPDVPMIFITAHDEPWVHEAARECGAAAVLIKPFAGRKLLETIRIAIAKDEGIKAQDSPTRINPK